jgi:hypothetical protein
MDQVYQNKSQLLSQQAKGDGLPQTIPFSSSKTCKKPKNVFTYSRKLVIMYLNETHLMMKADILLHR